MRNILISLSIGGAGQAARAADSRGGEDRVRGSQGGPQTEEEARQGAEGHREGGQAEHDGARLVIL